MADTTDMPEDTILMVKDHRTPESPLSAEWMAAGVGQRQTAGVDPRAAAGGGSGSNGNTGMVRTYLGPPLSAPDCGWFRSPDGSGECRLDVTKAITAPGHLIAEILVGRSSANYATVAMWSGVALWAGAAWVVWKWWRER